MKLFHFIGICLSFLWTGLLAQPVLELNEVKVKPKDSIQTNAEMTKIHLAHLNSVDLGEAVMKLPGVLVKAYGGVNGMKTLQVRGLGGHHSMLVLDGFPVYNAQAGMVDLSIVPMDFITYLALIYPLNNQPLLPVSSLHASNVIQLKSSQNSFIDSNFKLKLKLSAGSFGFQEYNYFMGIRRKKFQFNTSAKYRDYLGNYSYQIENYSQTIQERRKNNQLRQIHLQASVLYQMDSSQNIRLNYTFFKSSQGLPGATILYAQTGEQHLINNLHLMQLYYEKNWKHHKINSYHQYQHQHLIYEDPNYLNAQHYLRNSFQNQQVTNGINYYFKKKSWYDLSIGYESQLNFLDAKHISSHPIKRIQQFLSVGNQFKTKIIDVSLLLNGQYISDKNPAQTQNFNTFTLNPSLSISKQLKNHYLSLWYKNAMRVPSFNELYYQSIGNVNLKPERSNQLVMQYIHQLKIKKHHTYFQTNVFFNQVNDKIVSMPSKNLFIWTIINVQKVNIYGADVQFNYSFAITKNWSFDLQNNYTYQKAMDLTDDARNQIAYTPEHVLNTLYILQFKNYSISYALYYQSKQFALNENIAMNEVKGFVLHDFSLNANYTLKKHKISIHLFLKNITNENYMVVKNYYMPGRNLTLSLNYELF